ncbi:ATP-binding protein [Arthrobacter sp. B10-11]|uniref:AAA family ATPase n=1 Tax=Arthrobacter sp. B10-11 TaxID=3081160 RepID=UPI00295303D1|nr:ATP-binding protein [Arthrobacter sp. B10-11]MDV8148943.1 ATP-binding protein [Arthrobacter sp. B10-11]
MATADQVKALVKSHGEGDDSRFYSVAMQVAAKAARSGQEKFAQDLRDLVDSLRSHQSQTSRLASVIPVSQPRGDLASLLSVSYPEARLRDLCLVDDVQQRLEHLLIEQRQRERLGQFGFKPSHRILLVGPPGTGKTLSAQALAGELGIPLFTIRLDGLITKFLGETAAKLRLIFDALGETRGVYLFDEVDALAGERAASNDVGEIRRVLNSFLQFLENDNSESLLVAATNHPQLLDAALFRRFDAVITYPLPDAAIAKSVIRNRLTSMRLARLSWVKIGEASQGLSHAEIATAAEAAARKAILSNSEQLTTQDIVTALRDRAQRGQLRK